jgi:hypothetical protein
LGATAKFTGYLPVLHPFRGHVWPAWAHEEGVALCVEDVSALADEVVAVEEQEQVPTEQVLVSKSTVGHARST